MFSSALGTLIFFYHFRGGFELFMKFVIFFPLGIERFLKKTLLLFDFWQKVTLNWKPSRFNVPFLTINKNTHTKYFDFDKIRKRVNLINEANKKAKNKKKQANT